MRGLECASSKKPATLYVFDVFNAVLYWSVTDTRTRGFGSGIVNCMLI